jgi:hypothetical protein
MTPMEQFEPIQHVAKRVDVLGSECLDGAPECLLVLGQLANGFGGVMKLG